jgi:hypothetical protein
LLGTADMCVHKRVVAETITKAKHNIQNKNEIQTNLELRMANLEKALAKQQQQQKNSKGGRSECRSSLTVSKTAPPTYNSHNHSSRSTTAPPKNHRQIHAKIQQTHESESSNQTGYEQKHKSHVKKHILKTYGGGAHTHTHQCIQPFGNDCTHTPPPMSGGAHTHTHTPMSGGAHTHTHQWVGVSEPLISE